MTKKLKKTLTLISGIVITFGFLIFLFYKVDYTELMGALKGANYWWLIPNIILIMVTMVFRAYRWKHMIQPIYCKLNYLQLKFSLLKIYRLNGCFRLP